jgi:hypothetical protein
VTLDVLDELVIPNVDGESNIQKTDWPSPIQKFMPHRG